MWVGGWGFEATEGQCENFAPVLFLISREVRSHATSFSFLACLITQTHADLFWTASVTPQVFESTLGESLLTLSGPHNKKDSSSLCPCLKLSLCSRGMYGKFVEWKISSTVVRALRPEPEPVPCWVHQSDLPSTSSALCTNVTLLISHKKSKNKFRNLISNFAAKTNKIKIKKNKKSRSFEWVSQFCSQLVKCENVSASTNQRWDDFTSTEEQNKQKQEFYVCTKHRNRSDQLCSESLNTLLEIIKM